VFKKLTQCVNASKN